MTYSWRFATTDDYIPVCQLFRTSGIGRDELGDIQRRVITPIILNQLIAIYDHIGKLCAFISFAHLSDEAEQHMAIDGINASHWRSGKNFWAIDFIVQKGHDGYKILRNITKAMGITKAKYFRHKHREIREVRVK